MVRKIVRTHKKDGFVKELEQKSLEWRKIISI